MVHVAGDLKNWPAMQNLLRSYLPPWKIPPVADSLVASASRHWWGGTARTERLLRGTEDDAVIVAKDLGLHATFRRCCTLATAPQSGDRRLSYYPMELQHMLLPVKLNVQTTAPKDAHVLLGVGGHSGLELIMGSDGGHSSSLRWVRSSAGWSARGDLMSVPTSAQQARSAGDDWCKFSLQLDLDGRFEVSSEAGSWGSFVPSYMLEILQHGPLSFSVGTLDSPAKWAVCRAEGMQSPSGSGSGG